MEANIDVLGKLIADIEGTNSQHIEKKIDFEEFELWNDPNLTSNLSGNIGALFVRALLNHLNVNEHHVFKWRLENKYRQYQILNYYFPNCMPETLGVSQLLRSNNGEQKIRERCKNGFFIKATLGHRSGTRKDFDRSDKLDEIIILHQQVNDDQEENDHVEEWMLQRKLNFTEEFRIHTFSRDLIYGLTFIMEGLNSSLSTNAEEFVLELLEKLPDTILEGTLIGWDIGITDNNEYYVIEGNFTGFHPEFCRGFQTSGYFGDGYFGSIMCAWLNTYFRNKYHISIGSVGNSLLSIDPFYKEFMFYVPIFKNRGLDILRNKATDTRVSAIIYLGEHINDLLINLIKYFQVEKFRITYYLIINQKNISKAMNLFPGKDFINVITEDTLLTGNQHIYVDTLSYEKRKEIYCFNVLPIIQDRSYFII